MACESIDSVAVGQLMCCCGSVNLLHCNYIATRVEDHVRIAEDHVRIIEDHVRIT